MSIHIPWDMISHVFPMYFPCISHGGTHKPCQGGDQIPGRSHQAGPVDRPRTQNPIQKHEYFP